MSPWVRQMPAMHWHSWVTAELTAHVGRQAPVKENPGLLIPLRASPSLKLTHYTSRSFLFQREGVHGGGG